MEQIMVRGGSEVERSVSFYVNDGGPRRRGAVEPRRRMRAEVRA
jgi:hypothetical protein